MEILALEIGGGPVAANQRINQFIDSTSVASCRSKYISFRSEESEESARVLTSHRRGKTSSLCLGTFLIGDRGGYYVCLRGIKIQAKQSLFDDVSWISPSLHLALGFCLEFRVLHGSFN